MLKLYKITASNHVLNTNLTFTVPARSIEDAEDEAFKCLDEHWAGSRDILEATSLDHVGLLEEGALS